MAFWPLRPPYPISGSGYCYLKERKVRISTMRSPVRIEIVEWFFCPIKTLNNFEFQETFSGVINIMNEVSPNS